MSDKNVAGRLLVPLLACLLLSACVDTPPPPLRVGTNQWPGYEPLYLARDLGAFDEATIHLAELPSATDVILALRNQTLDAGALTLDEVLAQLQDGIDLRIVLVMDVSNGADALVARPGIKHLAQLRGRRVGVENTAVGALLLQSALQRTGLTAADIKVVHLTENEHVKAYREHLVDAVVTFDPKKQELLAAGARTLFDSSDIPGRIVDVLAVRGEALATRPEAVRALVRGQFTALDYIARHPENAITRMAPRLGIAPAALLSAFRTITFPDRDENLRLLLGASPRMRAGAEELAALMVEQGLLARHPDLTHAFDGAWLQEQVL